MRREQGRRRFFVRSLLVMLPSATVARPAGVVDPRVFAAAMDSRAGERVILEQIRCRRG